MKPTLYAFRLPQARGEWVKMTWQAKFTESGLAGLSFSARVQKAQKSSQTDPRLRRLMAALAARLNSQHADLAWEEFDLLGAPDFHLRVWKAMRQIPFGQVATYAQVAAAAGSPAAFRACGQACGANPIPVFIPCHRVVAANGLGGFGCGRHYKELLLRSEGFDV